MTAQFCVFCGERPVSKNREHVIPQWLIAMTGDPNREVTIGLDLNSTPLKRRRFAFKSFTFPACEQCNERFSGLETRTREKGVSPVFRV